MGILQARILEWVAMPSSRRSFPPRDWTCVSLVSCTGRRVLYHSRHLWSPEGFSMNSRSLYQLPSPHFHLHLWLDVQFSTSQHKPLTFPFQPASPLIPFSSCSGQSFKASLVPLSLIPHIQSVSNSPGVYLQNKLRILTLLFTSGTTTLVWATISSWLNDCCGHKLFITHTILIVYSQNSKLTQKNPFKTSFIY